MNCSLKQLAQERESRGTQAPESKEVKPVRAQYSTSRPPHTTSSVHTTLGTALKASHRAIRLSHSIGLCICSLSLFLIIFPWVLRTQILIVCLFAFGVYVARYAALKVHNLVPKYLQEGQPPTEMEIANHDRGLFSPTFTGPALQTEWEVALENLAFVCTYGKRNCLTNAMYTGEITLSKIVGLVAAKVREGFRCG